MSSACAVVELIVLVVPSSVGESSSLLHEAMVSATALVTIGARKRWG